MPIAPNTQFDHYEILAPIGKGGMGEVFRARDTRLNREVALKVLPAEFAQDADRLRRFEQEAMATSSLNHPNILTVYDFGTHEGNPFLVMELLEGEELRAQLEAGAIAPRKAIEYAQQIAAGLAAAHEKGIVHRDLKPENLFVTKDGRVKILDFGLAKLRPPRNAPTGSDVATQKQYTSPGTVMGTVAYMSPEQVRGQDLEQRSDIFSFGLILYEMLAGQRAFQAASQAETMAAIANAEPPDLSELNSKVSPQLDKIVRRCLEKKPEMRFHSAHDLGFALSTLTTPSGSRLETATALPALTKTLPASGKARLFGNARLWMATTAIAVLGALLLAFLYIRQPSPAMPVTRFSINLPKGAETRVAALLRLALSPDGRRLVFSSQDAGGKNHLWLRSLDSFATQLLPGTEGTGYPFWSPDGRYIVFFADNKLKKLDTGSGVIETICSAGAGQGGDWNRDGVILFNNGDGTALSRVNAVGGKPEAATDAAPGETHSFPSFLPDGNHFLFRIGGGEHDGIYVGSLESRERKLLIPLSSDSANNIPAVWAPPGYILYAPNRTTLLARAFDPDRLELKGEPFRVAENLLATSAGAARFTVSANGVLAFIQNGERDTVQLTWLDRSGKRLGVAGPAGPWTQLRLSPDERLAALTRDESGATLWILDLVQGATTRFENNSGNTPAWSPDSKQLAFTSSREGQPNLFLKSLTANVQAERLLPPNFQGFPGSWSPDGKFLIFMMLTAQTQSDLWLLPMLGDRKPQPLLQTKANEVAGRVSPDGNWLAYLSNESGSNEIYVTQFPQPVRSWQISTNGGVNYSWRGDGKELYFVSGHKLMAVSVNGGTEFQAGTPQPLFEIEGMDFAYAPSKDGQRFLVSVVMEKALAPPINVVLNWAADLKK